MDGRANAQLIKKHNWITYLLVRLCGRRSELEIALQLYCYLRGLDDFVDDPKTSVPDKKIFIAAERGRIDGLYTTANPADPMNLVIQYDIQHGRQMREWLHQLLDVFEFDIQRTGQRVISGQIMSYSRRLSEAYTHFLIAFLEPRYQYNPQDAQLAHACHLLHMLRDHEIDHKLGYYNIGTDEAQKYGFQNGATKGAGFQRWLNERLNMIEEYLSAGRQRLQNQPSLRIKLIVYLYCHRYCKVLNHLRRHGLAATKIKSGQPDLLRMAAGSILLIISHAWQRLKPW